MTGDGYQLRHREMGVFQGECMGMGFWHPMSEMPEQGLLRFPTYSDAAGYRAFLTSPACSAPLRFDDLTIEPFDAVTSAQMKLEEPLSATPTPGAPLDGEG